MWVRPISGFGRWRVCMADRTGHQAVDTDDRLAVPHNVGPRRFTNLVLCRPPLEPVVKQRLAAIEVCEPMRSVSG